MDCNFPYATAQSKDTSDANTNTHSIKVIYKQAFASAWLWNSNRWSLSLWLVKDSIRQSFRRGNSTFSMLLQQSCLVNIRLPQQGVAEDRFLLSILIEPISTKSDPVTKQKSQYSFYWELWIFWEGQLVCKSGPHYTTLGHTALYHCIYILLYYIPLSSIIHYPLPWCFSTLSKRSVPLRHSPTPEFNQLDCCVSICKQNISTCCQGRAKRLICLQFCNMCLSSI